MWRGVRRYGIYGLGMMAARLIVGAGLLLAAGSERELLFVLAGLCALALIVWEVWWWRSRRG